MAEQLIGSGPLGGSRYGPPGDPASRPARLRRNLVQLQAENPMSICTRYYDVVRTVPAPFPF